MAEHGYRYDGVPGTHAYNIAAFERYALHLPPVDVPTIKQQECLPWLALWAVRHNPIYTAELQWRISLALMPLVLSILVIPLSRVMPRRGARYLQLIAVLALYVVYINCLLITKHWVECSMLSGYIGMWWVHIVILLGAFSGWWKYRCC